MPRILSTCGILAEASDDDASLSKVHPTFRHPSRPRKDRPNWLSTESMFEMISTSVHGKWMISPWEVPRHCQRGRQPLPQPQPRKEPRIHRLPATNSASLPQDFDSSLVQVKAEKEDHGLQHILATRTARPEMKRNNSAPPTKDRAHHSKTEYSYSRAPPKQDAVSKQQTLADTHQAIRPVTSVIVKQEDESNVQHHKILVEQDTISQSHPSESLANGPSSSCATVSQLLDTGFLDEEEQELEQGVDKSSPHSATNTLSISHPALQTVVLNQPIGADGILNDQLPMCASTQQRSQQEDEEETPQKDIINSILLPKDHPRSSSAQSSAPSPNTHKELDGQTSLPINFDTQERISMHVGDQDLSAIQEQPQPHHLYSQSITDSAVSTLALPTREHASLSTRDYSRANTPSYGEGSTMLTMNRGKELRESQSASPCQPGAPTVSLSPSMAHVTPIEAPRKRKSHLNEDYEAASMDTLSLEPTSSPIPSGSLSLTTGSNNLEESGSRGTIGNVAMARSSFKKSKSSSSLLPSSRKKKGGLSRTGSSMSHSTNGSPVITSSGLFESNLEDIANYLEQDLAGFENRLSY